MIPHYPVFVLKVSEQSKKMPCAFCGDKDVHTSFTAKSCLKCWVRFKIRKSDPVQMLAGESSASVFVCLSLRGVSLPLDVVSTCRSTLSNNICIQTAKNLSHLPVPASLLIIHVFHILSCHSPDMFLSPRCSVTARLKSLWVLEQTAVFRGRSIGGRARHCSLRQSDHC